MTRLACARFEADLAEALAAPRACDPELAESLRAHAETCASCRGCLELVDLAAEPAESRDPFPDPPPGYWERFEAGLGARLASERRRGARRRLAMALAASLAVAVLLTGLAFKNRPSRSETRSPVAVVDEPEADGDDGLDAFPAAGVLDGFADDDGASLFSGPDDLTPEDQERLLEWLRRERERRTGGAA
jgi:hypothetical protein